MITLNPTKFDVENFRVFGKDLLNLHLELYEKYIKIFNDMNNDTPVISGDENQSYNEYSEWAKKRQLVVNAIMLHELYFSGIYRKMPEIENAEEDIKNLIDVSWGSYNNWLKEFRALAKSTNGWVVLCNRHNVLSNIIIEGHDKGFMFGDTSVLIVLDTWEHSYLTEFGLDKDKYFDEFIDGINWSLVYTRYKSSGSANA